MIIQGKKSVRAEITVPGDKSISHRAVMFGSISKGVTRVSGFLTGEDCIATVNCFRKLGIDIEIGGSNVTVYGKGLRGLVKPESALDCANSGTTTRLISGILCAQNFDTTLTGDKSLQSRPMNRVISPLSQMGAKIGSTDGKAPLYIEKADKIRAIDYIMPVASAQVKSAVILAALYADGVSGITEKTPSRNHTETMLSEFGASVLSKGNVITVTPQDELYAADIRVPSDISSAAFFMVLGLILPHSEITIKNVGINPTRTGIIDVLRAMGGDIVLSAVSGGSEPVADITVKSSVLCATEISGDLIPRLIDEIPIIAVAACFASGQTVIRDAAELKVKESNRIKTMTELLTKMGGNVTETEDGMVIGGTGRLAGGVTVFAQDDHRIAMSAAVAGCAADSETIIADADCVGISFPTFFDILNRI